MINLMIGLIIGITMGLTGAGGALIAIPLFMQLLSMDLKAASSYSLLAVFLASFINFLGQRKATDYKIALPITLFSFLGSFLAAPYKKLLPEEVIVALICLISAYALYGVWKGNSAPHGKGTSSGMKLGLLSPFLGVGLGVLTTFSGLGGGVLMVPLFLKVYRLPQKQAVATSLLAVGLSSLFSLLMQIKNGFSLDLKADILLLISGMVASALMLKLWLGRWPTAKMEKVRKIIFSVVVLLAVVKLLTR